MNTAKLTREYPRTLKGRQGKIKLVRLTESNRDQLLSFARSLDEDDLLFLRVDITDEDEIDRLVSEQHDDQRVTLLAEFDNEVIGFCSLVRQDLAWMRHLGEIRIIVGSSARGHGLGTLLAKEAFAVARDLGLTKIVARMAREQQGAQALFQQLGFSAEALLADWVIDRTGKTRDLVIMSHDVTALTN
jgi:RimJ/RimL family protein N-acetyltransferase